MKKFLLTTFFAMVSLFTMAQSLVFSDKLYVTINDETTGPIDANVYVANNGDGTINFTLKNFILSTEDTDLPVGNINVENIPIEMTDNYVAFAFNGDITIADGDDPEIDFWAGPGLGELPLILTGRVTEGKMYVAIDIDLTATLEQVIHVTFGKSFEGVAIYNDMLTITINDETTDPIAATVYVSDNGDGTIDFMLNNFMLSTGDGDEMPVGNIVVENIQPTMQTEYMELTYADNLLIGNGNLEGYDFWAGPALGELPLVLNGKLSMEKLYVTIDIDVMEMMEQIIHVTFGSDFDQQENAIQNIVAEKANNIYDLAGRRISNMQKGFYIVNGKKVIK